MLIDGVQYVHSCWGCSQSTGLMLRACRDWENNRLGMCALMTELAAMSVLASVSALTDRAILMKVVMQL